MGTRPEASRRLAQVVSDSRTSSLQRAALTGSTQERVAWLASWLRTDPACSACCGLGGKVVYDEIDPERLEALRRGELDPRVAQVALSSGIWNKPRKAATGTERRWRVEAAAHCNDEAARLALGWTVASRSWHGADEARTTWRDASGSTRVGADADLPIETWAQGLSRWGRDVTVRAALAASGMLAGSPVNDDERRAQDEVMDAARAWLACPCDAHSEEWWHRYRGATDWRAEPSWLLSPAASHADGWATLCVVAIEQTAQEEGPEAVREAIRSALVPWLLDPAR